MTDLVRQEIAASATSVVVKVGTRVLTHADGTLDTEQIARLANQLYQLQQTQRKVVLVSSGAVGAGMSQLGLRDRPADLAQLQAIAAIGQTKLIESYDRTLREHGCHAAQVLLTADDLHDRTRYLNVRNTLLALLDLKAIPIINENDTVAVDELMTTFGDNDRLAALVTNLLRAPLLVILSDVEGLFDGDPQDSGSRLISTVSRIDDTVLNHARTARGRLSKGGMASKLEAARMATAAGENVIIAGGRTPDVLLRILAAEPLGTAFLAQGKSVSPWKRWIGFSVQTRGRLRLDDGARDAIMRRGRSLLAIGIVAVEGEFIKGDAVQICDASGREFARGLTNYSAAQVHRILGLRSDQIAEKLGHCPYEEVIHRDNMAVTST
jgi:glutamate 5-kinase